MRPRGTRCVRSAVCPSLLSPIEYCVGPDAFAADGILDPEPELGAFGACGIRTRRGLHIDTLKQRFVGGNRDAVVGRPLEIDAERRVAPERNLERTILAVLVEKPHVVDVADRAVSQRDVLGVSDRRNGHVDIGAHEERDNEADTDEAPERGVENRSRPEDMLPDRPRRVACAFGLFVGQREVIDEPAWLADLRHDVVASVDAERAGDAFELLAVADVDAHGADVHAGHAVDAVARADIGARLGGAADAQLGAWKRRRGILRLAGTGRLRGGFGCGNLRLAAAAHVALAAWLTAPLAVGHGYRVGVHHRRLDARPGAHVDADLLPAMPPKC